MENCKDWTLLILNNKIGTAQNELGENLMRIFLYTLTEEQNLPKNIFLMNEGVLLACDDEQCIGHFKTLIEKGVEVYACGTCLNFYGKADNLAAGKPGNMYDTVSGLAAAGKVVTL